MLRITSVLSELKARNAKSVIDLGCGEGNLLRVLAKENDFTLIAGVDVSLSVLNRAAEKIKQYCMNERQKERITLFQSSLCYRDKRFKGYDAAVIMEVIEHLDENRLPAFASVVFGDMAAKTVIITTPNKEYNVNYGLAAGCFRHSDHRFEWKRAQFRAWAEAVAIRYGYALRIETIGQDDVECGAPTQMGVFTK
jgi:3' terminal RNA ribose 2'-O-methyltransferase Hen1